MNAKQNIKSVSTIEEQLSSVQISQFVRNAAIHDAHTAEFIVDAILWVYNKVERLRADAFVKPNLKY